LIHVPCESLTPLVRLYISIGRFGLDPPFKGGKVLLLTMLFMHAIVTSFSFLHFVDVDVGMNS